MPFDSAISRIRTGESSDLGRASARIARQAYSAFAEIFMDSSMPPLRYDHGPSGPSERAPRDRPPAARSVRRGPRRPIVAGRPQGLDGPLVGHPIDFRPLPLRDDPDRAETECDQRQGNSLILFHGRHHALFEVTIETHRFKLRIWAGRGRRTLNLYQYYRLTGG